jgi:hypothetical protein
MTGWTLETLKSLLDEREGRALERRAADKENISIAMSAAEKAITKADSALEKRLDGMNEFRASLNDQNAQFLPRAEYGVQHKALDEKVVDISQRLLTIEARKSGVGSVGNIVLGSLLALAAIAAIFDLILTVGHKP